jgi:hypothetical protein
MSSRSDCTASQYLESESLPLVLTERQHSLAAQLFNEFLVCVKLMDRFAELLLWREIMATTAYSVRRPACTHLTTCACMQSLAARVGIITGRSLGAMCLDRYGSGINKYIIWAFQQVGTFGDDIQACVGATVALQIMTNIPFWSCVLIVLALSIVLTIAYYWSPTKLELLIGVGLAGMLALTIANAAEGHAYFPDILKGWVAPLIPEGQVRIEKPIARTPFLLGDIKKSLVLKLLERQHTCASHCHMLWAERLLTSYAGTSHQLLTPTTKTSR